MRLPGHLPLFWTICLINGVVLVVAALVLLLSPARVSADAGAVGVRRRSASGWS